MSEGQRGFVYDIAAQCPTEGGRAVFVGTGVSIPSITDATPPNATLLPTGQAIGMQIVVVGDFTIDADYIFRNCEVIMQPAANIQVPAGRKLTLNGGTWVHSCGDTMWNSIHVHDSAVFNVTQAKICTCGNCPPRCICQYKPLRVSR